MTPPPISVHFEGAESPSRKILHSVARRRCPASGGAEDGCVQQCICRAEERGTVGALRFTHQQG